VDGFITGMERAYMFAYGRCKQEKDQLKHGPQFDAEMNTVLSLCVLAEQFDFDVARQQLETGLEEFYKDSQNIPIPVENALD